MNALELKRASITKRFETMMNPPAIPEKFQKLFDMTITQMLNEKSASIDIGSDESLLNDENDVEEFSELMEARGFICEENHKNDTLFVRVDEDFIRDLEQFGLTNREVEPITNPLEFFNKNGSISFLFTEGEVERLVSASKAYAAFPKQNSYGGYMIYAQSAYTQNGMFGDAHRIFEMLYDKILKIYIRDGGEIAVTIVISNGKQTFTLTCVENVSGWAIYACSGDKEYLC